MSATNFANHGLTSFDNNNNKNEALNYSSGVLTTSGTGWTYGVPYERFGRRVLELTFKYNF
jgi:beta-glucanase (GH16 family)